MRVTGPLLFSLCVAVTVVNGGCVSLEDQHAALGDAVARRTGRALGSAGEDAAPLPKEVDAEDGIDADEAVAVALWRSPSLHARLVDLDDAVADLDAAVRPANPRLSLLAPIEPRQLAAVLTWSIDALWQTPLRAEAQAKEVERVSASLVQVVLDFERDVRIAHSLAIVARERTAVTAAIAADWSETTALAEARARHGDIALADVASVTAELTLAEDNRRRAARDVAVADARLLALLGDAWPTLPAPQRSKHRAPPPALETLTTVALARPDVKAAELAVNAGAARAHWERSRVFNLLASIDGQAPRGELVPAFSPGVDVALPIFSQNQGGVGRAEAAIRRAGFLYRDARLRAAAETTAAWADVMRARDSVVAADSAIIALDEAAAAALAAWENGNESYVIALDARRRASLARLRRVDLEAELWRAEAELARAVGGHTALSETP